MTKAWSNSDPPRQALPSTLVSEYMLCCEVIWRRFEGPLPSAMPQVSAHLTIPAVDAKNPATLSRVFGTLCPQPVSDPRGSTMNPEPFWSTCSPPLDADAEARPLQGTVDQIVLTDQHRWD
jgi:hypothetical protein